MILLSELLLVDERLDILDRRRFLKMWSSFAGQNKVVFVHELRTDVKSALQIERLLMDLRHFGADVSRELLR